MITTGWYLVRKLVIFELLLFCALTAKPEIDYRFYGLTEFGSSSLQGTGMVSLLESPDFPQSPSIIESVRYPSDNSDSGLISSGSGFLEFPQIKSANDKFVFSESDSGIENYGLVITGLFYPPESGLYSFSSRSSNVSRFTISSDHQPGNESIIVSQETCCLTFSDSASESIALIQGQAYYFELLFKDSPGDDWWQVAYSIDNKPFMRIPLGLLQKDVSSLSRYPQSEFTSKISYPVEEPDLFHKVKEGEGKIQLSVDFNSEKSEKIQWQKFVDQEWVDLPNQNTPVLNLNVSFSVRPQKYRVVVGESNSLEIIIEVEPDLNSPEVVSISSLSDPNSFFITFSEPVERTQVTDISNYRFDGKPFPEGTTALYLENSNMVWLFGPLFMKLGDRPQISVENIFDRSHARNQMPMHQQVVPFFYGRVITFDFNNPDPENIDLFGSAEKRASGGLDNSGYLKITDALRNQNGAILIKERFDLLDAAILFYARIGDASSRPADGFSFNIADDMPSSTYALAEEGYRGSERDAPSGLVVSFDNWNSGSPDKGVGIEVKYKNESKAFVATPEVIFEGKPTVKDGVPSIHRGPDWFPVTIDLKADGAISLVYDNATLLDNVDIGWEGISDAQFGFGARTGGAFQSHWIDELSIIYTACSSRQLDFIDSPNWNISANENNPVNLYARMLGGCLYRTTLQWFFIPAGEDESIPIPGATSPFLSFNATPNAAGQYFVRAQNVSNDVTSEAGVVSVLIDKTPPKVLSSVHSFAENEITIVFSEPIDPESLLNPDHSSIEGLSVLGSQLLSPNVLKITTSSQKRGVQYLLKLQNITDLAHDRNILSIDIPFGTNIPSIRISKSFPDQVQIQFSGILQTATKLNGPWTIVPVPIESLTEAAEDEVRYYRTIPNE